MGLSRIFYQAYIVFFGQRGQTVQVSGSTSDVHRYNRSRSRRDGCLYGVWVDIICRGLYIDEYGHCSDECHGTGGGNKRIGWYDNFVAQADAGGF